MSAVSIRFDARQLKEQIQESLDKKVKAVTSNRDIYTELLELYYTYIVDFFPEDTGALKGVGSGIGKNGYERWPSITINASDGIRTNPREDRPNGSVRYGRMALERVFGDNISAEIFDMLISSSKWPKFCKEAEEILTRGMNDG